jgi:hypothetical protein
MTMTLSAVRTSSPSAISRGLPDFGPVLAVAQHGERIFPAIAVLAAGLEVLMAFGAVHIQVRHFPVALVLAAVLLACGVVVWSRTSGKWAVTGATALVIVGAVELLAGLHYLR